jgi:hypothetical protein
MEESDKQVPDVKLEIEVKEVFDSFWPGSSKTRVFNQGNVPEHIDCPDYPVCQGGGVSGTSIREVIRDTLKANEKYMIVRKKCSGRDGSSKKRGTNSGGTNSGRSCIRVFEITVTVR